MEQYFAAIVDFDEAIRLKPDYADAYYARGNARHKMGLHEDAINDFDVALCLNRMIHMFTQFTLFGLLRNFPLKQYSASITDFDEAIRLKPGNADIYYSRGLAKGMLGLFREERQDLLIALELAKEVDDLELITEIQEDLYQTI